MLSPANALQHAPALHPTITAWTVVVVPAMANAGTCCLLVYFVLAALLLRRPVRSVNKLNRAGAPPCMLFR